MSTVEELRRLLAAIADTASPAAAEVIRHRVGEIERDTVAESHLSDAGQAVKPGHRRKNGGRP